MNCDLAKLDFFGTDYIFEVFNEIIEKELLDVYITDILKCTLESYVSLGGGKIDIQRYYDIINPERKAKEKSPEEIIKEFATGLNLEYE